MPPLAPRLAILGLVLCAAPSAAAQSPAEIDMQAHMQTYQPAPDDFITRSAALLNRPDLHACGEDKARAGPAPKVVRTMPAPGSTVRPGALVLSVTFDRPMACRANLMDSRFPVPCPGGKDVVVMSPDRRTLSTVCQVEAGASYSMPLVDFVGEGGARSERYDLAFLTSTEAPAVTPRDALAFEKAGPARP